MFIVETVCYRKTWALFSDERPHKNPGSEPVIVSNLKHALFCTVKVVSTYTETSCIEHGDHINSHLIPFIIINPLNNSMWTAHALSRFIWCGGVLIIIRCEIPLDVFNECTLWRVHRVDALDHIDPKHKTTATFHVDAGPHRLSLCMNHVWSCTQDR